MFCPEIGKDCIYPDIVNPDADQDASPALECAAGRALFEEEVCGLAVTACIETRSRIAAATEGDHNA